MEQQTKSNPTKKTLWFIAKLLISGGLLYYVSQRIDWPDLWERLKTAQWGWIALGFLFVNARTYVIGYRLHLLLKEQDLHVPVNALVWQYYIGNFFSMFLPSRIGGDVIRGYYLAKYEVNAAQAVSALITERALGFLCLTTLPFIVLVFAPTWWDQVVIQWGVLICGVLMLFILLLFTALGQKMVQGSLRAIGAGKINFFEKLFAAFNFYTLNKASVMKALALSYLFNLTGIFCIFLYSVGLELKLNYGQHLLFMPLIWIANNIPITFGGFGIREEGILRLYTMTGITNEEAGALATVVAAMMMLLAMVGGVVWLVVRGKR